jgi:hypothetical protein
MSEWSKGYSKATPIRENPSIITGDTNTNSHLFNSLFIFFAGLLVFSFCLFDFFVSDDFIWIKRGVNFSFSDFFHSPKDSSYNMFRPLVTPLFFVLHRAFGLSPLGCHLTSILLHVFCGLLFYYILSHLPLSKNISGLSSVIFVSHFVHEETIFWISSICIPLSCLFYLLSILFFLKWLRNEKIWIYFLSLGSGILAFFTREESLTLPLILLLLMGLKFFKAQPTITNGYRHKIMTKALISLVPFFLFFAFYLKLRNLGLPDLGFASLFSLNPANLLKNAVYFSVNLIIPIRFIFDMAGYHYSIVINSALRNISSNLALVIFAALAIAFLIYVLLVWIRKTDQVFKLLLVTFFILLFPHLLFPDYGLRFTYFPAIGFSLICSYLILPVLKTIARRSRYSLKTHVCLLMIIVLVFNFSMLFERHLWWKRASKTCEETITKAGVILSSLPVGSTVYFSELPFRIHGAYIFNNGFPEAINLFYPSYNHEIKTIRDPKMPEVEHAKSYYLFKYEKGEFHRLF